VGKTLGVMSLKLTASAVAALLIINARLHLRLGFDEFLVDDARDFIAHQTMQIQSGIHQKLYPAGGAAS
jgi:hypothetical protein